MKKLKKKSKVSFSSKTMIYYVPSKRIEDRSTNLKHLYNNMRFIDYATFELMKIINTNSPFQILKFDNEELPIKIFNTNPDIQWYNDMTLPIIYSNIIKNKTLLEQFISEYNTNMMKMIPKDKTCSVSYYSHIFDIYFNIFYVFFDKMFKFPKK